MKSQVPIGQGHGVAGRFAGLSDPYGEESFAEVVLLPIPFDKTTTYRKGCDKGPSALIEASRNLELYDLETEREVYLKGIFTAPPIRERRSEKMIEAAYLKTKEFLERGKMVVTVGGEHTVSFGPIRAYTEHFPQLTVLQLDAHADLQNSYENNPWSHACVMKRVQELPTLKKIVSVGIRSMSRDELPYLDRANTLFAHEIEGNTHWINQVLEKLTGPVYVTFDLDVFDSSLMPSTGTPEPGGLNWDQALKLLKQVSQKCEVVGFDIVELLPNSNNPAPDYLAAKLIYKLISYKYFYKGSNQ